MKGVGSEHRQHRHNKIKIAEQLRLARPCPFQGFVGQIAEEAKLIKIDRKDGHGDEQHQDLQRVDGRIADQGVANGRQWHLTGDQ